MSCRVMASQVAVSSARGTDQAPTKPIRYRLNRAVSAASEVANSREYRSVSNRDQGVGGSPTVVVGSITPNVSPWGPDRIAIRPNGESDVSIITEAPSCPALSTLASTSAVLNQVSQCDGVSPGILVRSLTPPTLSSPPGVMTVA